MSDPQETGLPGELDPPSKWGVGTTRTFHLSVSVRGLLRRVTSGTKRERRNATVGIVVEGRQPTPEQLADTLMDELAQGHEVLPLNREPCDGWDWKTGCPGHVKEQA